MSVNLFKSILECQEFKTSMPTFFGVEFNKKFCNYSIIKKMIERNTKEKKRMIIINFDVLFFKYLNSENISIDNKSAYVDVHHLFSSLNKDIYEKIFSSLNLKNSTADKNLLKSVSLVILGLDLISEQSLMQFFNINKYYLNQVNYSLFLFSVDNSFINLNDTTIERKKSIIKSKLNYYAFEKMNKIVNNKNLLFFEVFNLLKLTKDVAICEFVLNQNKNILPAHLNQFEKVNFYVKEFKDIFELKEVQEEPEAQPSSTFKLALNEKELQAKNEVVLPYLKQNKEEENRIIIDQEDLNELYEEDPDGDLDI